MKRHSSIPKLKIVRTSDPTSSNLAAALQNNSGTKGDILTVDSFGNYGVRRVIPQDIGRACSRLNSSNQGHFLNYDFNQLFMKDNRYTIIPTQEKRHVRTSSGPNFWSRNGGLKS